MIVSKSNWDSYMRGCIVGSTSNEFKVLSSSGLRNKNSSFSAFVGGGGGKNAQGGEMSASKSIEFYETIAPVATSIDIIAEEVQAVSPLVFDKKTDELLDEHPILQFLSHPNGDVSYSEFILSASSFYLIAGEVFFLVTARNENSEPIEMFALSPACVSHELGDEGFIEKYSVSCERGDDLEFDVSLDAKTSERRFFNAKGAQELYHVRAFNPNMSNYCVRGQSKLKAIFAEMTQYFMSSEHNIASLENGAKHSLILSPKKELGRQEKEELCEVMQSTLVGYKNASRVMLLPHQIEAHNNTMPNRDMDFEQLQKRITSQIYNRMRIPLPMVLPEQMTLANMDAAKLSLYDNAVLPVVKKLFDDITDFIMHRYKNSECMTLAFSEKDIPALKSRNDAHVKLKKELSVYTDDEIRDCMGSEPLDAGEIVYKPANLVPVPVGADPRLNQVDIVPVEDVDDEPADDALEPDDVDVIDEPDDEKSYNKDDVIKKYIFRMSEIQGADGNRIYSDEQIKEHCKRYFGDAQQ